MIIELMAALCLFSVLTDMDDYNGLPTEAVCKRNYEIAEDYLRELEKRQALLGGWSRFQLEPFLDDALWHRQFWYAAWCVRWPAGNREYTNDWLHTLRGIVGEESFWSRNWPAPLPMHHFPLAR